MFLHLCVILFMGVGGFAQPRPQMQTSYGLGRPPWMQTPLGWADPPDADPSRVRQTPPPKMQTPWVGQIPLDADPPPPWAWADPPGCRPPLPTGAWADPPPDADPLSPLGLGRSPLRCRPPSWMQIPPGCRPPPYADPSPIYGQQVGGTHPTTFLPSANKVAER